MNNLTKCPKCGESYYAIRYTTSTAAYYPVVMKDGVNVNPDRNQTTYHCQCIACGAFFDINTEAGDVQSTTAVNGFSAYSPLDISPEMAYKAASEATEWLEKQLDTIYDDEICRLIDENARLHYELQLSKQGMGIKNQILAGDN